MASNLNVGTVVVLTRDVEMRQIILRAGAMGEILEEQNGAYKVRFLLPRRLDVERFGPMLEFTAVVVRDEITKATKAAIAKLPEEAFNR